MYFIFSFHFKTEIHFVLKKNLTLCKMFICRDQVEIFPKYSLLQQMLPLVRFLPLRHMEHKIITEEEISRNIWRLNEIRKYKNIWRTQEYLNIDSKVDFLVFGGSSFLLQQLFYLYFTKYILQVFRNILMEIAEKYSVSCKI